MDYLNFFQLKEDPFGLTPDSSFFFPSKMHNEALSSLDYAVEQKEGFSLIAGEPGTGKTTILKIFIDRWREKAEIALIMTPRLSPEELLQAVLEDFDIKVESSNKNDLIKAFRNFLIERSMTGRRVIIIVDEAQNLSDESLEELRLLSNLETEKEKLLQIILVGQPEIRQKLHAANLKQLDQRLTVRSYLRPLTLAETIDYVNFRLVKAGKGTASFSETAIRGMYQFSNGIPRLVNLVASRSMMVAYIASSHTIDKKHVQNAVSHLADVSQAKPESKRWITYTISLLLVVFLVAGSAILFKLFQDKQETGSSITATPAVSTPVQTIPEQAKPSPPAPAASTPVPATSEQAKPSQPAPAVSTPVPATPEQVKPSQPAKAAIPSVKTEQSITKTVTVKTARVRNGPSLESGIGPLLVRGTKVTVIGKSVGDDRNKWYKVRLSDGTEGWVVEYQLSEELRR